MSISVNRVSQRIKEETEHGRREQAIVQELTATSDISFIPAQRFGKVQDMLKVLARKKKDWGIQMLESGSKYLVEFEDVLRVEVEKKDWDLFVESVLTKYGVELNPDSMQVDLSSYLTEAMGEELGQATQEMQIRLNKMLETEPMSDALAATSNWIRLFGANQFAPYQDALLGVDHNLGGAKPIKTQVQQLVKRVQGEYQDDLGGIQMISAAVSGRDPLNTLPLFEEYDYLYGSRVHSTYQQVKMVFEVSVAMNWIHTQSIYATDPYVLDVMDGHPQVKVVKNVIFPVGKVFSYHTLRDLRKELDASE